MCTCDCVSPFMLAKQNHLFIGDLVLKYGSTQFIHHHSYFSYVTYHYHLTIISEFPTNSFNGIFVVEK